MHHHKASSHGLAGTKRFSRRKRLRHFLYVAAIMLSMMGGKPARASIEHKLSHGATPSLRISPDGWGSMSLQDLQLVLDAVVAELAPHFPQRQLGTIRIVHGDGGPLAFYDKSAEGEYVVRLSAQHGRWHQFVYQFSHELCHIYSNFDNKTETDGKTTRGNQWFEESVCEAGALFTLRQLARRWETAPPAPQFEGYGATLRALADYLMNEPHRHLSPSKSFARWFESNHADLEEDPYLRDKNEVVANLMLPLFEQTPHALEAIGYLNRRAEDADRRFPDYLRVWHDACPEAQRGVVGKIIALFEGREPATETAPSPSLLAARTAR